MDPDILYASSRTSLSEALDEIAAADRVDIGEERLYSRNGITSNVNWLTQDEMGDATDLALIAAAMSQFYNLDLGEPLVGTPRETPDPLAAYWTQRVRDSMARFNVATQNLCKAEIIQQLDVIADDVHDLRFQITSLPEDYFQATILPPSDESIDKPVEKVLPQPVDYNRRRRIG